MYISIVRKVLKLLIFFVTNDKVIESNQSEWQMPVTQTKCLKYYCKRLITWEWYYVDYHWISQKGRDFVMLSWEAFSKFLDYSIPYSRVNIDVSTGGTGLKIFKLSWIKSHQFLVILSHYAGWIVRQ